LQPALLETVGAANVVEMPLSTIAEDFSQFSNRVPGFYFFVGATARGLDPKTAPANHSPQFMLDEQALAIGRRAMLAVSRRFLSGTPDADAQ
jgi:amidohydrolase